MSEVVVEAWYSGNAACLKTVVGGKQGHASCVELLLKKILLLMSVEFHGDHRTVMK